MHHRCVRGMCGLAALVVALAGCGTPRAEEHGASDGRVNVREFAHLVKDGDWSPALQAAIDRVSESNGYEAGGTVVFPPGTYRVDRSIVLGGNKAHWGLHLLGYGATLVGTEKLNAQPLVNPEPEEKDAGVPILVVKSPPGIEGASYCIEGLRFTREGKRAGIGISVPWKQVPKCTTFRSLKFHGQNIGVHIKYAWQFSFTDCIFRGNTRGMVIQSHGNNVGIVNCTFRRNHAAGLVFGPDRGQWASNAQHISGSIFEANKGYGILLLSSAQTVIAGCYFEANGTSIGVMTPWQTTIDTNLFWGYYGHGWRVTPYADNAHIVLEGAKRVRLRNNHYAATKAWFRRKDGSTRWEYVPRPKGPGGIKKHAPAPPKKQAGYAYEERPVGILIAGTFEGDFVLDGVPSLHNTARIKTTRVASDTGLHYYQYDANTNTFVTKSLLPK